MVILHFTMFAIRRVLMNDLRASLNSEAEPIKNAVRLYIETNARTTLFASNAMHTQRNGEQNNTRLSIRRN